MTHALASSPSPSPSPSARRRPLSPPDRSLLEALRAAARAAQRGGRGPVEPPAGAAAEVWGVALMRALAEAAARPLVFHPRGADAVAFGEAWALGLVTALGAGDAASATFLAGRVVRRERRREVLWLARRYAEALGTGNPAAERLESFQSGGPPASQPAHRTERKERA
jgi:hypothetical protein